MESSRKSINNISGKNPGLYYGRKPYCHTRPTPTTIKKWRKNSLIFQFKNQRRTPRRWFFVVVVENDVWDNDGFSRTPTTQNCHLFMACFFFSRNLFFGRSKKEKKSDPRRLALNRHSSLQSCHSSLAFEDIMRMLHANYPLACYRAACANWLSLVLNSWYNFKFRDQ